MKILTEHWLPAPFEALHRPLTASLCRDPMSEITAVTLHHVIACKHHPVEMVSTYTLGFSVAFQHEFSPVVWTCFP